MAVCGWCTDSQSTTLSLVFLSASEKVGTTSLIEQLMEEYDPPAALSSFTGTLEAQEGRGSLLPPDRKPPIPTVRDFEEYSFQAFVPDASGAALSPTAAAPTKARGKAAGANGRDGDRQHGSVVTVSLLDVGRPLRYVLLSHGGSPARLGTSSEADSLHFTRPRPGTATASASASTGGLMSNTMERMAELTSTASSHIFSRPRERAATALIKRLRKADAVVFVVNSSDVEPCDNHGVVSSEANERRRSERRVLSLAQVNAFLALRRCLAEMVEGGGLSAPSDSRSDAGSAANSTRFLSGAKKFTRKQYPLIVVVANKQDALCALSPDEVAHSLGLSHGGDRTVHSLAAAAPPPGRHHRAFSCGGCTIGTKPLMWQCVPSVAVLKAFGCKQLVERVVDHYRMVARSPGNVGSGSREFKGNRSYKSDPQSAAASATTSEVPQDDAETLTQRLKCPTPVSSIEPGLYAQGADEPRRSRVTAAFWRFDGKPKGGASVVNSNSSNSECHGYARL